MRRRSPERSGSLRTVETVKSDVKYRTLIRRPYGQLNAAAWHERPMRYFTSDFTVSTVRNDPDRSGDLWRTLYADLLSDRTLDRRPTDAAISCDLPFTPSRALRSEIVPRS